MKTEGSIKSRYQTGQSPRRKRKDKQGIWASHLEMNRNQHCLHPYVAVWPVVGNLSYHHNHLPGSHYWSVNSGTRSWNKRLTPTFQLPMFYQPASHAFAPRILSVHFPYPILSLTHILNWISIQVLILLSCACLPSCPMLKSVLLLPRCVVFALLLWWANPLVPIITPVVCRGGGEYLPSMRGLGYTLHPQPLPRRALPSATRSQEKACFFSILHFSIVLYCPTAHTILSENSLRLLN